MKKKMAINKESSTNSCLVVLHDVRSRDFEVNCGYDVTRQSIPKIIRLIFLMIVKQLATWLFCVTKFMLVRNSKSYLSFDVTAETMSSTVKEAETFYCDYCLEVGRMFVEFMIISAQKTTATLLSLYFDSHSYPRTSA